MTEASVNQLFAFDRYADREALVSDHGESISYLQLARRADQFAEQITAPGQSRPFVFIVSHNSVEALIAYLACMRNKHVALLLPKDIDQAALKALLGRYKPNYLLSFENDQVDVQRLNQAQHKLHDDLALLLATSGTTGSPKLVRLSYKNLQANAESICQYLPINAGDTAITALPMAYSYGLSVINTHLLSGARLAVTAAKVVDKNFWCLFKSAEVNSLSLVPFGFKLLQQMRFQTMNFPHLRYVTQAGGKLSVGELDFLKNLSLKKSLAVYLMYGQTEATARMAYLASDEFLRDEGSIGNAIPGGHFDLLDEQGDVITVDDEVGELVYSGPNVMMGYAEELADLAESAELQVLHTGDLARRKAGRYYLAGRLRRFIKILGVRVDLDAVECMLQGLGVNGLCLGEDDNLQLAIFDNQKALDIKRILMQKLNINTAYIQLLSIVKCPMLSNGKPNYQALKEMFDAA